MDLSPRSTTRSLKRIVPIFKENRIEVILDYGAGTLRNTNYLLLNDFKVIVVDTLNQLARIKKRPEMQYIERTLSVDMLALEELNVDAVISNFVLNLLSTEAQGQMAINIAKNLKINGYLLIEIKKDKIKLDNYYQEKNLDNLFIPLGFNRLGFIKNSVSMAGIYQKVESFPLN
jgi:hypothetical protein